MSGLVASVAVRRALCFLHQFTWQHFINDYISFIKKKSLFTQIIYNLVSSVWFKLQNEAPMKSRVRTVNNFLLICKILWSLYSSLLVSIAICLSLVISEIFSIWEVRVQTEVSNLVPNDFWPFDYKVICDFYVYLGFWINGIYSPIIESGIHDSLKVPYLGAVNDSLFFEWTKYLHFSLLPSVATFCSFPLRLSLSYLFTRNHKVTWSHHFSNWKH